MQDMIHNPKVPTTSRSQWSISKLFPSHATYNALMVLLQGGQPAGNEGIFLECRFFSTAPRILILAKQDWFVLQADWKALIDTYKIREIQC